jgi:predicted ArsR family transcriptional regulator
VGDPQLTQVQLDALRLLRSRAARADEVAAAVLRAPQTTFGRRLSRDAPRLLDELKRRGLVEARGRWRQTWHLTEAGREAIADSLLALPQELLEDVRTSRRAAVQRAEESQNRR